MKKPKNDKRNKTGFRGFTYLYIIRVIYFSAVIVVLRIHELLISFAKIMVIPSKS